MMRSNLLALAILLALMNPKAQAADHNLRQSGHLSRCSNSTASSLSNITDTRCLQGGPIAPRNDLLNSLIAALLPTINSAIQAAVPDPLILDLSGAYSLSNINLGCGTPVGAAFDFTLASVTGLSTIFIETLEVVQGTDSISGCFNQPWSATFNMAIASTGILSIDDIGSAFSATGCGLNVNEAVGGDIVTLDASLAGLVDLAGDLCGGVISINSAQILDTLDVGWTSVTADLTGVPITFAAYVSEVTTLLSSTFQTQLKDFVEPIVRPVIQEQLDGATAFAPAIALPAQATVIRNQANERVQNFFDAGAQFLGWGNDD